METQALQVINFDEYAMTVDKVKRQVNILQEVMRDIMHEGEHYGKIPGTKKPTLLKPGAEKISVTFRLAPSYDIKRTDMPDGHREFEIVCTLTHIPTGQIVGQGVGSCSTMEVKYRYRNVADYEITGDSIPKDAKERKAEYRKQGFGMKMIEGIWEWVKYKDTQRTENPDLADTYNTVLKMAKKRAHVDAVLTATAASDIFTQDVEDMTIPAAQAQPMPDEIPDFKAPKATPQKKASKFDFLKVMGELKKELGSDVYYEILGGQGYTHANEITDADPTIEREKQIKVYKAMMASLTAPEGVPA